MATFGPARWPGASTFPGATQYPGQDLGPLRWPLYRLLVSHSDFRSTPVWVDYSNRIRSWSTSRGRSSELEDFDAGACSVELDNRDRVLDPVITPGVRPMNRVWLQEEFGGERRDLFYGYAEAWQQSWDKSGLRDAVTTVRAVDEFKVLRMDQIAAQTLDLTIHEAMITLLDQVASRAPRTIQTSVYAIGAMGLLAFAERETLGALVDLLHTEGGSAALFMTASGMITFLNADHRTVAPYTTVQATFGDGGGSELPYKNPTQDYSEAFLFNEWTLTNGGGDTFVLDQASQDRYGRRVRGETILGDNPPPLNAANALLAKYKDPFQRVTSFSPEMNNPDTALAVFRLELMDRIRFLLTPPGGGARVDQQLFVQKIDLAGEPSKPPSCTLSVSPL